jgi:dihydrolipoamide dehydrogenase
MEKFDILIIGGGPAGYTAAVHAAHLAKQQAKGASVQLRIGVVEPQKLGGTCVHNGCIPVKTLIKSARLLEVFADASAAGVSVSGSAMLDVKKAFERKEQVSKALADEIAALFKENGVQSINGKVTVSQNSSPDYPFDAISAEDNAHFTAKKVILATGSLPATVSFEGLDVPEVKQRTLNTDELLNSDYLLKGGLPKKLVILGGGVVSLELSRIFKAAGSDVHIVEILPHIVPFLDTDVSKALSKSLADRNIKVSTGTTVVKAEWNNGKMLLHLCNGETLEATHLLLSTGRVPNVSGIDAKLLKQLDTDARGFILVDEAMKTRVKGLFAAGDVNGVCMLAHAAIEMGCRAARAAVGEILSAEYPSIDPVNVYGESVLEEYRRGVMGNSPLPELQDDFPFYVPGCVFGEPEIGYIGYTEDEAREKFGNRISVGRVSFANNARAMSAGRSEGFVKVITVLDAKRIVGVHIVGANATELINEVSVMMSSGMAVEQYISNIHTYPSFGRAILEAVANSLGSPVC